jgi:hypothetical protein
MAAGCLLGHGPRPWTPARGPAAAGGVVAALVSGSERVLGSATSARCSPESNLARWAGIVRARAAVLGGPGALGALGLCRAEVLAHTGATPIRPLRVTSAASAPSSSCWVPAGRLGSTMYRVSAVESHTLISAAGSSR